MINHFKEDANTQINLIQKLETKPGNFQREKKLAKLMRKLAIHMKS